MKQLLLPALALALLTQCQKSAPTPDPAKPEDQLPPATQTGAGTFGCLLNGQPWTPTGRVGLPNFVLDYDPGYAGGKPLNSNLPSKYCSNHKVYDGKR